MERDIALVYRFMTKEEVENINSFSRKDNVIYLNMASKFDKNWVSYYGSSSNISSTKSYSGIIAYSPSLILDNISKKVQKIEIVLNSKPSVDYFVALFFIKHLIIYGKLPKYYELFVDYVEKAEMGYMPLVYSTIVTPFAVIKALDKTESARSLTEEACKQLMVEKGIALMEHVNKKLTELNKIVPTDLFNSTVLNDCDLFNEEADLLKKDYRVYYDEVYGQNSICEKTKLFLNSINGDGKKQVDAILFNCIPKSILTHYWARYDVNSPSRKGYVLTLIPEHKYAVNHEGSRKYIQEKILEPMKAETVRVVIQVDPQNGLWLKNLGKYLELAEQRKEEKLFESAENINKWRDRSNLMLYRFRDSKWCTSRYSWYDGRFHNYMLVDSPTIDSLLTIEEIKDIVKTHTDVAVKSCRLKFAFPFYFEYSDYKKIHRLFINKYGLPQRGFNKQEACLRGYFLPYVEHYMFGTQDSKTFYSSIFKLPSKDAVSCNSGYESFDIIAAA
ncbi:MAG: hypothetical protein ACOZCL_06755 [Bacillota bacterium]